jgi:hypothetical protein
MKRIASYLLALATPLLSIAQEQTTDSVDVMTQNLDEVVVSAPKVIHKPDMDVLYPSKSAIEKSTNGIQLIKNLMIPSLFVNDVLGSVTSLGQSVELRINGRIASVEQVRALQPETVKRVEWMDNPGLRYNDANAVLNFIVVNPTAGGEVVLDGMPALNAAWGQYDAGVKLNHGRSQWGLDATYKLTNKIGAHRDYEEKFTYANGESMTRTERPTGGYLNDNRLFLEANYNYIKPDTTVLVVTAGGYKLFKNGSLYQGIQTLSNGDKDIDLREYDNNNSISPSVQLYLEQHFAHKQILAVDAEASFYNGTTYSEYKEREVDEPAYLTEVYTSIKDRNQAYGITADYIKNWKTSKLTTGVNYTANRNRSTYINLDNAVYHQNQDKVYLFGEYMQSINKLTLTGGLGAQYTSFLFKESDRGSHSWNLRPRFSAVYKMNSTSQFRLTLTSWQTAPSLSETNVAPQQIDGFQWQIGNQGLKTSSTYRLVLQYNYTLERVMGTMGVKMYTNPNAIAPYYEWQGDKLIRSYENSDYRKGLVAYLSPMIEVIPNWLTIDGTLTYATERTKGTGYNIRHNNWSGNVAAELSYKDFGLTIQYVKSQKVLRGESLSWGESISILGLSYTKNNFSCSTGLLCAFTKYDNGSKLMNQYNTNIQHTRLDIAPLPFVKLYYNIQWGHQKYGARRLVESDASVEKSNVGSR